MKKPTEAKPPVKEEVKEEKKVEAEQQENKVEEAAPKGKKGRRRRGQNKKRPYTFREELGKQLCPSLVCHDWL